MARKHQAKRDFYTTGEVAARIGVARLTVSRWARDNLIPAMMVGPRGNYLIPAAWLDEQSADVLAQWVAMLNGGPETALGAPEDVEPGRTRR